MEQSKINKERSKPDGADSDEQSKLISSSTKQFTEISELGRQFLSLNKIDSSIYRPSEIGSKSGPAIQPKGKIFNLIPKLAPAKKSSVLRNREPKFVPFEPYKAAVNPIFPYKNGENHVKVAPNRNNLDLAQLVENISTITNAELQNRKYSLTGSTVSNNETQAEKQEKKIKELEAKLSFQAQVNAELKSLLIASVGEDFQIRVNGLTEDKLHLAKDTEQIEFLVANSQVWRSKFLASSLMVEELARWKASLTQKNNLLVVSNKNLLEQSAKIRDMQVDSLQNLKFLSGANLNLNTSHVVDLTTECLNITQQLVLQHSNLGMPQRLNLDKLDAATEVEKMAIEALQNSNQPLISTDEAFKAIIGQAFPSLDMMKKNLEKSEIDHGFEVIEKPGISSHGQS